MSTSKARTLKVQNDIRLEDLRWLVKESAGAPGETRVKVTVTPGDRPFDSETRSISVDYFEEEQ